MNKKEKLALKIALEELACSGTAFITGAWSTGEYIDEERTGKDWDFHRKNLWEQFMEVYDEVIAGRKLDDITEDEVKLFSEPSEYTKLTKTL